MAKQARELITVYNNGEQAVEQRLETLVTRGDYFVEDLRKKSDSFRRSSRILRRGNEYG